MTAHDFFLGLGNNGTENWTLRGQELGCLGDLVSRLIIGPSVAFRGLLWGLIGDTKWTY